MTSETRTKILALLASTLASIILSEVAVREVSKHLLYVFDVEMWQYASQIKTDSPVPGLVEDHRHNAEAKLMGVRIRTDDFGFRRADPALESARTGDRRLVIALGDSVTLGWGVPEGFTYGDILERKLAERPRPANAKRITVLNAGIGNSNTSMEVARYEHNIRALHPEWVILGFFINDAEVDPVPAHNPILRTSALAGLLLGQLRTHFGKTYLNYQDYYRGLYTDSNPGWARLQAAMAALGEDLKREHVNATLLLLPEMHEPKNFGPFKDIYDRVTAVGRANGFEVIDASRAFPDGPGNRYWVSPSDAHPNAEAQAMFAAALAGSAFTNP